jgi:hypothetical protein
MLVSVDLFNAIAVRVRLGKKGFCAVLDREAVGGEERCGAGTWAEEGESK